MTNLRTILATTALVAASTAATAEDLTITVWAGGSNDGDSYRMEAIEMAADMLEREYAILGEALNIIVTSHLDIAPWSQAGLIVPVEDYLDMGA